MDSAARYRVFRLMQYFRSLISCALILGALSFGLVGIAKAAGGEEKPLRTAGMIGWPVEDMARALDAYVPEELAGQRIPGASIAVVSGCEIVWQGAYGQGSVSGSAPITTETRFRSDGFGNLLTAYAAMSLARDKMLFLDAPLARATGTPAGFPDKMQALTLRDILWRTPSTKSETGIGLALHGVREARGLRLESDEHPADNYFRAALSSFAGRPFAQFMQARLLTPLGMASSGFGSDSKADAHGHAPLAMLVAPFVIPFVFAFLLLLGLIASLRQIFYGPGQVGLRHVVLSFVFSAGFATLCAGIVGGWRFLFATVIVGLGYVLAVFLIIFVADFFVRLSGIAAPRRRRLGAPASPVLGKFVILTIFAFLATVPLLGRQVPLFSLPGQAAFRTTAGDMARFVIAFDNGEIAGVQIRDRMLNELEPGQGPVRRGLGLAVLESHGRPLLWQQSHGEGYSGLIVADPVPCRGVVVLVNAGNGQKLARDIASQIMGPEN